MALKRFFMKTPTRTTNQGTERIMKLSPRSNPSIKTALQNKFDGNYRRFFEHFLGRSIKGNRNQVLEKCCFHGSDNQPSLSINLFKGLYFCFSCRAQGDFLDFAARHIGRNIKTEFVKLLKDLEGIFL
jgi:hypothetical protein